MEVSSKKSSIKNVSISNDFITWYLIYILFKPFSCDLDFRAMSDLIIGNLRDQLDFLQLHPWSYSYPRVINFSLWSAERVHSLVVLDIFT